MPGNNNNNIETRYRTDGVHGCPAVEGYLDSFQDSRTKSRFLRLLRPPGYP